MPDTAVPQRSPDDRLRAHRRGHAEISHGYTVACRRAEFLPESMAHSQVGLARRRLVEPVYRRGTRGNELRNSSVPVEAEYLCLKSFATSPASCSTPETHSAHSGCARICAG